MKIEMYQCNSFYEDGEVLCCTCGKCKRILEGKRVANYWKYTCIAILLGAVVGMIAFTNPIIKALEICK